MGVGVDVGAAVVVVTTVSLVSDVSSVSLLMLHPVIHDNENTMTRRTATAFLKRDVWSIISLFPAPHQSGPRLEYFNPDQGPDESSGPNCNMNNINLGGSPYRRATVQ